VGEISNFILEANKAQKQSAGGDLRFAASASEWNDEVK
jgi:hypothetical protein